MVSHMASFLPSMILVLSSAASTSCSDASDNCKLDDGSPRDSILLQTSSLRVGGAEFTCMKRTICNFDALGRYEVATELTKAEKIDEFKRQCLQDPMCGGFQWTPGREWGSGEIAKVFTPSDSFDLHRCTDNVVWDVLIKKNAGKGLCRPCKESDAGCTQVGVADQAWCDWMCPEGMNDPLVCVVSHCFCNHDELLTPSPTTEATRPDEGESQKGEDEEEDDDSDIDGNQGEHAADDEDDEDDSANPPSHACHTCVIGDECFRDVRWAMLHGFKEQPSWYVSLDVSSCFETVQLFLHQRQQQDKSHWEGMVHHPIPSPCESEELDHVQDGLVYCR